MDDDVRWYQWIVAAPFFAVMLPGVYLAYLAEKRGWTWAYFPSMLFGSMLIPMACCFAWAHYHPTVRCDACHGRGYIDATKDTP